MARSKHGRVARLMLKAVRSLPEREQDVVLEYLLESGLGVHEQMAPTESGGQAAKERQVLTTAKARLVLGGMKEHMEPVWGGALGPDQQMIPVRLSEPQHRLLKEWCTDNGFPMAVVVRGLVERFLEGQERRAA